MISQQTIDAVKQHIDIIDIIGESVKLKKDGSNFVGLCPFHDEKSGSFKIKPSEGFYKCFGCGKSGDTITFIMEHKKVNYATAIKELAAKYNI